MFCKISNLPDTNIINNNSSFYLNKNEIIINKYCDKKDYTKILIFDPFNNRNTILKVAKNQKGIYLWETIDGIYKYVGRSINLYNRICSYFMPSILKTKARRVLKYFNKYGFSNIKLTLFIMKEKSYLKQLIKLEQYFINTLNPNLNIDLIASNSGYHESISEEIIDKLRKDRGIPVYVYKAEDLTLLYIYIYIYIWFKTTYVWFNSNSNSP